MKILAGAFLICILTHLAAVAWVSPESAANTSRFRLGWNYAQPDRADMLVFSMGVVVAVTAAGLFRTGALILIGAALAQLWAFLIWDAAPDYVLIDGHIWNASDGLLLLGVSVCIVGVGIRLFQLTAGGKL